jgi:hypothetical protein
VIKETKTYFFGTPPIPPMEHYTGSVIFKAPNLKQIKRLSLNGFVFKNIEEMRLEFLFFIEEASSIPFG